MFRSRTADPEASARYLPEGYTLILWSSHTSVRGTHLGSGEIPKPTHRTQDPDISDSEEEEGVPRYWLRIPMEKPRAGSYSPVPHVTPDFQNRSEQNETHLGEMIKAEPEQDRESVRDEE
ncbi:hypothetical protein DPX16_22817 [Anabarilius grahami]|uniref:Uncharacterized protein n=1 Tax=Anabarilius grahami TaxID=495550 RepID=A0A3N0ZAD7_ANAGA|nr:hypothetical protein DPX16_22817 [Anabarilius grahami]